MEKMAKLAPAYKKDGTVTAGNASGINDAAAAVLLMTAKRSQRTLASSLWLPSRRGEPEALDPAYMGLGVIPAVKEDIEQG